MRNTGHSFRLMCQALFDASSGTNVVIICETEKSAKELCERFKHIVDFDLPDFTFSYDRWITFNNGVEIQFFTQSDFDKHSKLPSMSSHKIYNDRG